MFITIFVVLPLEELIGMIHVLVELGIICSRLNHVAFFLSSYQRCSLDVLSNYNSSSLLLAAVAGPIFALLQLKVRDN